jgi:hypothetical protein
VLHESVLVESCRKVLLLGGVGKSFFGSCRVVLLLGAEGKYCCGGVVKSCYWELMESIVVGVL